MVRMHDGLRALGADSRIHSVCPVDDTVENAFSLPIIKPTRWGKLAKRFRREQNDWKLRISEAGRGQASFEAFSPPVALSHYDLKAVTRNIDLLHLHWVGGYFDFSEFFSTLDVPVVWTLHDQNPYLGGFHYQGDVDAATTMLELEYEARDIKRKVLAGSALTVIGNSQWNADQAMSTDVLPATTRVSQIYLPLPVDQYCPLPKAESKRRYQIDPGHFVVGFACATIDNRRKGFLDLIAAIERLPVTMRARTTLLSFGTQPSKEVRQRVSVPWVHLGRVSGGQEQSPIYSAMDVFVIPSLEEAFGQTALEAMACETAVVGTRAGGIPELVQDEVTGLLAPPRAPHRLARCIERLFLDADLRMACGFRGRRLAVERHATDVIARAHLELYEEVLDSTFNRSNASSSSKAA